MQQPRETQKKLQGETLFGTPRYDISMQKRKTEVGETNQAVEIRGDCISPQQRIGRSGKIRKNQQGTLGSHINGETNGRDYEKVT